jgi:CDP-2,3-bis-(O-geranylgeranyl)-sn-glycerol synthase
MKIRGEIQPLGPAKTVRGLLAAGLATGCAALLVGRPLLLGVVLGLCAIGGDLLSSCIKRRLGIKSSAPALGLDQSFEALVPVLVLQTSFAFQTVDIVIVVLAFFVLEIGLSRVLYCLYIRDQPMQYSSDPTQVVKGSVEFSVPARQRLCQQGALGLLRQHTDYNRPL